MPRFLVLVFALLPLTACDRFEAPDSMLDDYVRGVGRVLDVAVELTAVPVARELPRRRERTRALPEFSISLLDFFRLYGCELQHIVGGRNVGVGRLMHPSVRLEYELQFIRAAEACVRDLEEKRLIELLGEITASKREALPDVAWNAVWGTREIENLFTRSRGALGVARDRDAIDTMAGSLLTMEVSLRRIVGGDLDVDVSALDDVYQRWVRQPLMGQLMRGALLLTTRLNDAAALIEARLGDEPLCARKSPNRRAKMMHGIYMSVYTEQVRPYLDDIQHARSALLPPLQALAVLGGDGHDDAFAAYRGVAIEEDSEHSQWRALDRAVGRHTRAWQGLLEQCGMHPGG